jgi:hypothetical protein
MGRADDCCDGRGPGFGQPGYRQRGWRQLWHRPAGDVSEPMAQAMLDMALAKSQGLDNGVARTPEFSSPTTFPQ